MGMLCNIGDASNEQELAYHVNILKSSKDFKTNQLLQTYWNQHWSNCMEQWVSMYRVSPLACPRTPLLQRL